MRCRGPEGCFTWNIGNIGLKTSSCSPCNNGASCSCVADAQLDDSLQHGQGKAGRTGSAKEAQGPFQEACPVQKALHLRASSQLLLGRGVSLRARTPKNALDPRRGYPISSTTRRLAQRRAPSLRNSLGKRLGGLCCVFGKRVCSCRTSLPQRGVHFCTKMPRPLVVRVLLRHWVR